MNPSISERCEHLNIEHHLLRNGYEYGMGHGIDIYIDIPDLQFLYERDLLIQTILYPSIADVLADTYPHINIDLRYCDDVILLTFEAKPIAEEIFIDIIEDIINLIETIHEENQHNEDMPDIQYDRARTILRIL